MFNIFGQFYGRSSSWRKVRSEHLKNNPQCAACGRTDNLEVHHIVPYHVDPEKELDPNNLITLCGKYCHFVFGHFMDWKSWNVNVTRDCVLYNLSKEQRPRKEQVFGNDNRSYFYEIFNIISSCIHNLFYMFRRDNKS